MSHDLSEFGYYRIRRGGCSVKENNGSHLQRGT